MLNPWAVEWTWLAALGILVLMGWAGGKRRRRSRIDRLAVHAARRPWVAALSIGLAAMAIRAALLPMHPVPEPGIADEFSYLLAADTFTSGRLTNPPHPLWRHFETLCEISQPTYASKYPAAQGLVLAAGLLLAHKAWIGVWLSVGAMCAAIVWMLLGWLPPRWAVLGGFIVLVRIGIGSYWMDTYWGGAVAATGGALLYGALPRLMSRARLRDSAILGLSLAILANSRPFEGLLLSLPGLAALALWTARRGWKSIAIFWPAAMILVFTGAAMLRYNHATTGSPWVMPYQVHEAQYAVAPVFWFQKLRPEPVYHSPMLRAAWTGWAKDVYLENERAGVLWASLAKLEKIRSFFLGPLLTIPLFALPWVLRGRRLRLVYITAALQRMGDARGVFRSAGTRGPAGADAAKREGVACARMPAGGDGAGRTDVELRPAHRAPEALCAGRGAGIA